MVKDIPDAFCKIMKLDEDYFNNQIQNIIKKGHLEDFKSDSKIKHPTIGIFCKEGNVYAKILLNIKAEDLKLFLKTQEKKEFIGYSEDWQKYIGLVFKGRLHRVVPQKNEKYRLNALETFWGNLKRKLSAKGGIRKEKLSLYLGEYAWRYNHRKLPLQEQEKCLLNFISNI